ncbi:MAG: ABC transporter permease subunit [Kineosporiaceae bacterium]
MTVDTPAQARSSAGGGLRRALACELMKLRTTRTTAGLLVTGVALAALNAGLIATLAGLELGGQPASYPSPDQPQVLRQIYGSGAGFGYLVTLSLGILAMAGEYRHQTITPSLLAVPRRGRLVLAKLGASFLVAAALGACFVLAGAVVGAGVLAVRGYPLGLGADGVVRAMLLAVLACAVWAVFGFGLATLIRNQITALLTAIGAGWLLMPLLGLLLQTFEAGKAVAPYLPSYASEAMVSGSSGSTTVSSGGLEFHYLPWWGGALVLAAYGAVLAAAGVSLTMRRDVS